MSFLEAIGSHSPFCASKVQHSTPTWKTQVTKAAIIGAKVAVVAAVALAGLAATGALALCAVSQFGHGFWGLFSGIALAGASFGVATGALSAVKRDWKSMTHLSTHNAQDCSNFAKEACGRMGAGFVIGLIAFPIISAGIGAVTAYGIYQAGCHAWSHVKAHFHHRT